jgi:hypothetical protein
MTWSKYTIFAMFGVKEMPGLKNETEGVGLVLFHPFHKEREKDWAR